jgi:hypothetical protein
MNRNMQPKIHRSATTYSVQNSISDTLVSCHRICSLKIRGHLNLAETSSDHFAVSTNQCSRYNRVTMSQEKRGLAEKSRRVSVLSLVVATLIALFSCPLILFTFNSLRICLGRLALSGNAFYVNHWWDGWMLVCFLAGPAVLVLVAIGICSTLRAAWPTWPLIALPVALIVELCALIVTPNLPFWHLELVENVKSMGSVERRLETWGKEHSRFPLTQNELDIALGSTTMTSPYRQGSNTLNYQIEVLPNQSAPYQTTPKRPGIMYYAVDPRGQQFWLTISGLNAPYAGRPTMAHTDPLTSSKQPWGDLLVFTDVQRPI